jgi:hypothetical protein
MLKASRRHLLGGGLGGLVALPSAITEAMAATPFTTFAFAATGAPTPRTMPDRLAEIKNVVDFGADPTAMSDSTTAIQAAVNWTTGPNRGTIYFPLGMYNISAPITFNYDPSAGQPGLSIIFRGEGPGSIILAAGFSGSYIFDRHLASPNNTASVVVEKLTFNGSGFTAAMRLGSCSSIAVRDCVDFSLTTEDSAGNSSQNILLENCNIVGSGVIMGGSGAIIGCNGKNCTSAAFRVYGKGVYIGGNRVEVGNTAYLLGVDSAGTDQGLTGFAIIGCTYEGNWIGIDFAGTCSAFYIGGNHIQGHDGSNAGTLLTVNSYTYNSVSGATVLTMAATIPSILVPGVNIYPTGLNIAGLNNTNWIVTAASGTSVSFTATTGLVGSPSGGGAIGVSSQRGYFVRAGKASFGMFQGCDVGNVMDVAGCEVDNASTRAGLVFLNCAFNQSGGAGVGFTGPTNAYTAQFIQCNVNPIWTFSQLGTTNNTNVFEGDQFSITDSSSSAWAGNPSPGGGGTRALVRWNGSNYTVVAK